MEQTKEVFEKNWWADCLGKNVIQELFKQNLCMKYMQISEWPDLRGKSVCDVGGGPWSILLRTFNVGRAVIVDPLLYPNYILRRYANLNIEYIQQVAEDASAFQDTIFDEIWCYNCLQHVDDPQKVLQNIKEHCNLFRCFDWIFTPAHLGHPHTLTPQLFLNTFKDWEIKHSEEIDVNQPGCYGEAIVLVAQRK